MILDLEANRRVIDRLRAIGIILVICFHVVFGVATLLEEDALHQYIDSLPSLFNIAWQAMGSELVFLFSGFLLSYLLLRDLKNHGRIDIGDFYVRRLSRILPLYLVAIALYWLVRGFGITELDDLVLNLLFVSKLSGAITIIPIGWSLEVLVQAYLLLPFVVLLFLRSGHAIKLTLAAITISLAARHMALYLDPPSYHQKVYEFLFGTEAPETQTDLYYLLGYRATPFLLGFLLAYLVIHKEQLLRLVFDRRWMSWVLILASLVLIIISGFLPVHDQHSALYEVTNDQFWLWFWTLQRFVFALGICVITLCAWYGKVHLPAPVAWISRRNFGKSISRNIYSMYLFHPVFLIPAAVIGFRTYSAKEVGHIYTVEVVVVIALAVFFSAWFAQVLTRYVEAPAQRQIRKRVRRVRWRVLT